MGVYKKKWPRVFSGSWICQEPVSNASELGGKGRVNPEWSGKDGEKKCTCNSSFREHDVSPTPPIRLYKYLIEFLDFDSGIPVRDMPTSCSLPCLDYLLLVGERFCSDSIPPVELYFSDDVKLKAMVRCCGTQVLTSEQCNLGKAYQGWIVDVIREGLNISASRESKKNSTFLRTLEDGPAPESYEWECSRAYLLLPAKSGCALDTNSWATPCSSCNPAMDVKEKSENLPRMDGVSFGASISTGLHHSEEFSIDWNIIHDAAFPHYTDRSFVTSLSLSHEEESPLDSDTNNHLILRNGRYSIDHLTNALIKASHIESHCFFSGISTLTSLSTLSVNRKKMTYADYYLSTHNIVIEHPEQNLIELRYISYPSNMLFSNRSTKSSKKSSRNILLTVPPETCEINPRMKKENYLSLLFIPSIMHMVQSQLNIMELMESMDTGIQYSFKFLKALTPKACCMGYNYERMELIGDSFLKYAVARHVFFTIPEPMEGILSGVLQSLTRNKFLLKLAHSRNLPEYMLVEKFNPLNWTPPGTKLSKSIESENETVQFSKFQSLNDSTKETKTNFACNLIMKNNKNETAKDTTVNENTQCISDWMISDSVEALLSAYLEDGGDLSAMRFLNWIGLPLTHSPNQFLWYPQNRGRTFKSEFDETLPFSYTKRWKQPRERKWHTLMGIENNGDLKLQYEDTEIVTVLDSDFDYDMIDSNPDLINIYSHQFLPRIAFHKVLRASVPDLELRKSMEKNIEEIAEMENRIGYKFKHKKLMIEAFTHTSNDIGASWICFERLMFLGEGILDFIITRYLAECYPDLDPGKLTELRQASRNTEKLSRSFINHDLHRHLRVKSNELEDQIRSFEEKERFAVSKYDDQTSMESKVPFNHWFGNSTVSAPKVLIDAFHALTAAIYLDSDMNLDTVWNICRKLLEPLPRIESVSSHPTKLLIEICQQKQWKLDIEMTKLNQMVVAKVMVNGSLIAESETEDPVTARKLASLMALKKLNYFHDLGNNMHVFVGL